MTGGQPHIGTGKGVRGKKKKLMIDDVLSGCGVNYIRRTGAYDLKEIDKAINEGLSAMGVSAVIIDGECILKNKKKKSVFYPSMKKDVRSVAPVLHLAVRQLSKMVVPIVIKNVCSGCGLCIQLCENNAIE